MSKYLKTTRFSLLFLFFFCAQFFTLAQSKIENQVSSDLDSATFYFNAQNEQLSNFYAQRAERRIEKFDLDRLKGKLQIFNAGKYYQAGKYADSKTHYLLSLEISQNANDTISIIKCYQGLCNIAVVKYDLVSFKEIEKKFHQIKLSKNYLSEYSNLGNVIAVFHFQQQNYYEAITLYSELVEVNENVNNHEVLITLYYNLGTVYLSIKKYDLALYYFKKSEKLAPKMDTLKYGSYQSAIASLFSEKDEINKSIFYYLKAINIFEKMDYQIGLLYTYTALSAQYSKKSDWENFKKYDKLATDLNLKQQNPMIKANHFLYSALYQFEEKKYLLSLSLADSANSLSIKINDKVIEYESLELKSKIYKVLGDSKNEIIYLRKFHHIKDSLSNLDKIFELTTASLLSQITIHEKNNQITANKLIVRQKEASLRMQRMFWTFSITSVILFFTIIFFRMRSIISKKKNVIYLKEIELSAANQKLLELKLQEEKGLKQALVKDLDSKDKKLQSLALRITKNNEVFKSLSKSNKLSNHDNILKELNQVISSPEELDFLNAEINLIESNFQSRLSLKFPTLTKYDLQLATMLRLGLSSKEIATLLSIESSSVDISRHRLRKKLNMIDKSDIGKFMEDI